MKFTVETKFLLHAIKACALHVSKDIATREHLCGVFFHVDDNQLHVVATDGHTMAIAKPVEYGLERAGEAILKAAEVKLVVDLLKQSTHSHTTVSLKDGHLQIGMYITQPIKLDFAPWHDVVPFYEEGQACPFLVNPKLLGRACRSASLFDAKAAKTKGMRFQGGAEELEAMRMDLRGKLGELVQVVMPLGGPF